MNPSCLIRVGVAVPLYDGFDYRVPDTMQRPVIGARVSVPFGRRDKTGIVMGHPETSRLDAKKIKPIHAVLDDEPIFSAELLDLLQWAARYYHHPIGEVLHQAIPQWLRQGRPVRSAIEQGWALTEAGHSALRSAASLQRAPKQAAALRSLAEHGTATRAELSTLGISADALRRLADKALIESVDRNRPSSHSELETPPELTADQQLVVDQVSNDPAQFQAYLLQGVTGSGKTEVYLRLIQSGLLRGLQSLLLVPEIGLTPQLVARLRKRFGTELAVLHSGLTDKERLGAWQRAHTGAARLIVGTRSAIFASLPQLGLIVVDEEHDASFKQQTGFRYNARDLAIVRARKLGIKVVLGSATPSLESLHNALTGRYQLLDMPKRIGAGGQPRVQLVDLNRHADRQGLSTPLIEQMTAHLAADHQVILFLNRRGFAPALFCPQCAQCERCKQCDANLTVHARAGKLRCHHCGRDTPLQWRCPNCETERVAVGAGTQRVTDELQALMPDQTIARLDRDTASRVGAMDQVLEAVASGQTNVLIGTQMLTKGHDFPNVTLVGILNADQGLFGTDFRSEERLAQSILQVAGRAGRRDEPGEVLVQTHFPNHPLLSRLLNEGYMAFAELALGERERAGWPPYSHVAVIRAESTQRRRGFDFLAAIRHRAEQQEQDVSLLGPAAATMERRNGRYRFQLVLQSKHRKPLHQLLDTLLNALPDLPASRQVRWAIDVDPVEL